MHIQPVQQVSLNSFLCHVPFIWAVNSALLFQFLRHPEAGGSKVINLAAQSNCQGPGIFSSFPSAAILYMLILSGFFKKFFF